MFKTLKKRERMKLNDVHSKNYFIFETHSLWREKKKQAFNLFFFEFFFRFGVLRTSLMSKRIILKQQSGTFLWKTTFPRCLVYGFVDFWNRNKQRERVWEKQLNVNVNIEDVPKKILKQHITTLQKKKKAKWEWEIEGHATIR